MNNLNQLNGIKKILIVVVVFVIVISPLATILYPIQLIGNMFKNTRGTVKDYFIYYNYEGNFSETIDTYIAENRLSVNYKQLLSCALADVGEDPIECITNHDENGNIISKNAENTYFEVEWPEYHGYFSDDFFNDIHVLGKYTTSNWEKIGEHTELVDIFDEMGNVILQEEIIVDDYDWVYHDELKRGKCEESDKQKCYIELDDRDTYPFNFSGAYIDDRYGIGVDEETFAIDVNPYQVWFGNSIYAFSKGQVIESNENILKIKIIANDIDLIVTYEGSITSLFPVGEIVEATELIGYSHNQTFNLSTQNSNGEYINPSLFYDVVTFSDNYDLSLIANGHLLIGALENYQPDFSNDAAWGSGNPFMRGQCTWFAYGMFVQLYGYDPGFRGNGGTCAKNTKNFDYTKSPTPGSVFSVLGFGSEGSITSYGHVGIVVEVLDENTMIIIEGNMNGNLYEDSWDTAIRDWAVRKVDTHKYYYKGGVAGDLVFANPPQE